MSRTLGWIAVIGLGVGVISLSLTWTIGGRDLRRLIAQGDLALQACDLRRQSRKALLVAVHHDPQRSLNMGRDLVPQFLRQGQLSPHDAISHSLKTAFPQV